MVRIHARERFDMQIPLRTMTRLVFALFLFAGGLAFAHDSSNSVVQYLQGAELQAETDAQRMEIRRALQDMQHPERNQGTWLRLQRYADYQGKPGQWSAVRLLENYFVPSRPLSLDENTFYQDLRSAEAQIIIRDWASKLPAPPSAVVQGNSAFAQELYAQLSKSKGNLCFSPYSLSSALAMTYAGARGKTADEMGRVMHFPTSSESFHASMRDLQAGLEKDGKASGVQLLIANALWGQSGIQLLKEFLDTTKTYYGAGFRELDFKAHADQARSTINAWVAKTTMDKIQNLIAPGLLDSRTRLVLTNAIYFKGKWAAPFKKDRTQSAPFNLGNGATIMVPTMVQTHHFGYAETPDMQILEMTYGGDQLSMVVVLPGKSSNLSHIEEVFTRGQLSQQFNTIEDKEVAVSIPKFQLTQKFDLRSTLDAMGMPSAFSERAADFSGMTDQRDLFISEVIHKAFIDVSEEGTEAAAATAAVMSRKGIAREISFRADHPFLYFIRDKKTGSILFIGRVVDPRS
jgi:serine protease inhibitor